MENDDFPFSSVWFFVFYSKWQCVGDLEFNKRFNTILWREILQFEAHLSILLTNTIISKAKDNSHFSHPLPSSFYYCSHSLLSIALTVKSTLILLFNKGKATKNFGKRVNGLTSESLFPFSNIIFLPFSSPVPFQTLSFYSIQPCVCFW